jgi:multidrug efflux system membrane fusion protein
MRNGPALTLAALIAAGLAGTSCKKQQAAGAAGGMMPAVTANQPIEREVTDWDEYPGRLESVDMVEVRARVTGYLQEIHFRDGDEVKKGELLFVIDPRPYQAELERWQAELKQAETRLELASNEAARAEKLLQTKAISEEESDSRNKLVTQTAAAIQSGKAMVDTARLNLEYTRITAPISGRVGRKLITEGNLVNAGTGQSTLLTTIVSLDPIYCYFEPDEQSILKYERLAREGKQPSLRGKDMLCELALATETGFPHRGVIDFVDNRIDPTTGTLRIRGLFANPGPDHALEPGAFARVRVPASGKYQALLITDAAIGTDQEKKYVLAVNDQNVLEYRPVQLGPVVDGLRVVRDGIKPGDWIVVNGLMNATPGAKVKADRVAAGGKPLGTNAVSALP